jgi:hypothetical protein
MLPEEYAHGVASRLSFWAARRKEKGAFDKLPVEQQETIAMLEQRDAAMRGEEGAKEKLTETALEGHERWVARMTLKTYDTSHHKHVGGAIGKAIGKAIHTAEGKLKAKKQHEARTAFHSTYKKVPALFIVNMTQSAS